jgi:hypothetical protein
MSPVALGNGTLPRGPLHIPEGDDSCDPCLPQTARSGAHGFRSHRLRSLLMVCKYRRIRVTLVLIKDCVGFLWMAADALLGNQKELRSTGTNGLAGC